MAENVSVWKADDPAGTRGLVPLAENVALPPVVNSYSACVAWPRTKVRYLCVRVNESNRRPFEREWFAPTMWEWCRLHGDPLTGERGLFNCQIAEVAGLDAVSDDYAPNPPDRAYPHARLMRDWVYQDAGLDVAHMTDFVEHLRARSQATLASADVGVKSSVLPLLANIALDCGETLHVDPATGAPTSKVGADKWAREYEKGWELV